MPAGASARRRSARGCLTATDPAEAETIAATARPAEQRAAGDRGGGGCARRSPKPTRRSEQARGRRVLVASRDGWHPGRRRAGRGAAQGALWPAGLRHRLERRRHRHRLRAARFRASISARGPRGGRCRGFWSRAAATRWRPASRSSASGWRRSAGVSRGAACAAGARGGGRSRRSRSTRALTESGATAGAGRGARARRPLRQRQSGAGLRAFRRTASPSPIAPATGMCG